MTFNTIEDINGTQFDHQGFWWHCIDLTKIDNADVGFENIKIDFCTVSKTVNSGTTDYTIKIDSDLFGGSCYVFDGDGRLNNSRWSINNNIVEGHVSWSISKIYLYMGVERLENGGFAEYLLKYDELYLTLKELGNIGEVEIIDIDTGEELVLSRGIELGFNAVLNNSQLLLVKLLKTDFQFDCNQDLIVGEVNTVQLGTLTDYKPNGDLVGEYETKLSVLYNNKTIPVVWNSQLNDYTFDLDLTNVTEEKKIRFKVIVETNDVLNASETDVALDCKFETINTLAKLTELFRIGGVGRLGANLTLTNDLTVSKSVNLIGNDYSIDMASHKLVIPSDLTFKAQSVGFSNGVNTLQQEPNSTVELYDCTFTDCTGFGSVIDCQVDLASLSDEDDFTTKLTNCDISNCDMAILSGGNLEVDGCNVIGKISNKNYPYFLYQTDGNATILNSQFNLSSDTEYDYDIEFNSCIFTCGETATVNGYSHSELQNNNLSAFFDTQRNTSTIDVTYYYELIEGNVHLQSNKGYCHSVSNVDYVYKTNITLTRGE